MNERWKPIVGHEQYSVSDKGRIRRDVGGKGATAGRILTPKKNRKGYLHVDLSQSDLKTRRLIHQLVAGAFVPARPSEDHFPNHIDAVKTNNAAENLEWATRPENNAHARKLGLVPSQPGEANGRAKLTYEQVTAIRGQKGAVGQRKIARSYGVARSLVQRIHQGKAWQEWPADLRVRQWPGESR